MTTRRQVPAWPRGPERPDRDPERLRPAPPHPGFAPLPPEVDADVCRLCRATVPATDLARARHQEWDAKIVMVATVALTNQLSGEGAAPGVGRVAPSPDPTSGAGSSPPVGDPGSSPAPAKDAPTPTSGEGGHAGVAGANQLKPKQGASEAPNSPDAHQPPAGLPPPPGQPAGGAQRPGRGGEVRGRPSTVPAGADPWRRTR